MVRMGATSVIITTAVGVTVIMSTLAVEHCKAFSVSNPYIVEGIALVMEWLLCTFCLISADTYALHLQPVRRTTTILLKGHVHVSHHPVYKLSLII